MAKVRVYELAKEFGVESKAVMRRLQEMGEFVRSASSTIEAPVVRRLVEDHAQHPEKYQQEPTVYELAGMLGVSTEAILSTLTEWGRGAYAEHSTLDGQLVSELGAAHKRDPLIAHSPAPRKRREVSYAVPGEQRILLVNSNHHELSSVKGMLDGLDLQTIAAKVYEISSGNIKLNSIDCIVMLFHLDSVMDHQDAHDVGVLENRPPIVLLGNPYRSEIRKVAEACDIEDVVGFDELDPDGALLHKSIQYAIAQRERGLMKAKFDQPSSTRLGVVERGRLPDQGKSSVILMGAASYKDASLHDLPAVTNNLTEIATALTDPVFGGFADERVHKFLEPSLNEGGVFSQIAEQTQDVLLFYFSGHGLLETDGEFFLALSESRAAKPRFSAFPYQWVRSMMLESPAKNRIAILDCCFSGRAIEAMADQSSVLAGQFDVSGAYTLTATRANRTALAPENQRYTAFSGEFLRVLRSGVPGAGPLLTIADIYPPLARSLRARNYPLPHQQGSDTVADLALVRNRTSLQPAGGGYRV